MTADTSSAAAAPPASLSRLVEDIAKNNGFSDYELETASIDTAGGNYTSFLYTFDIKQDNRELNLFAKVTNTPAHARAAMHSHDMYEREVSCYTELADAFESLESKYYVPEEQRYRFPKYYGSVLTELEETVLLENLSSKGYVTGDRLESMDWEFARAGLRKLARFHALSFALEREQPELFDKLIRSKKETMITESSNTADENTYAYMKSITELVSRSVDAEHVPALEKFMASLQDGFLVGQYESTPRSVLAHGDYRISNMMVKYEEGALTDLLPLDYQIVYHGSPINDILYFLITGSDEAFRREHYEDYIQQYYYELARALAAFSLRVHDIYPRALYLQHVKEKLLYGLGIAIFMMPMMLATPGRQVRVEDLMAVDGKPPPAPVGSALYKRRVRGVVRDMARWGALSV